METPWKSVAKEAQITSVYRRFPMEFIDNDPAKGFHKFTVKIISKYKIIVPSYEEAKKLYFRGFFGKCTLTRSEPIFDILQDIATNPQFNISQNQHIANYSPALIEQFKKGYEKQLKIFKSVFDKDSDNGILRLTDESYRLSSHECFFLLYALDCVNVYKNSEQPMTIVELWDYFNETYPDRFRLEYAAYHYLRSNEWVVRLGTNYGCDFVLYKDGMPFHHSNFMVYVQDASSKSMSSLDLMAVNRVANQCLKKVLMIVVDQESALSGSNKNFELFAAPKRRRPKRVVRRRHFAQRSKYRSDLEYCNECGGIKARWTVCQVCSNPGVHLKFRGSATTLNKLRDKKMEKAIEIEENGSAYYKKKRLNFGPAINQHSGQSQKKSNNTGVLRPKANNQNITTTNTKKADEVNTFDVSKENVDNRLPQYYSYDDRSFMNSTSLHSDQNSTNIKSISLEKEHDNPKKELKKKYSNCYNNQLNVGQNYYDPFGYCSPSNYQPAYFPVPLPTNNNEQSNSKCVPMNTIPFDENDPANYFGFGGSPFIPYYMGPPPFVGNYYTPNDNNVPIMGMGYNLVPAISTNGQTMLEPNDMHPPAGFSPNQVEPFYVTYGTGPNNQMMLYPVFSPPYTGMYPFQPTPYSSYPPYNTSTNPVISNPLPENNVVSPNENYAGTISRSVLSKMADINPTGSNNTGNDVETNRVAPEFYACSAAKINDDNNNRQL